MGETVRLDQQSILKHYEKKTGNPSDLPPFSGDSDTIQKTIQKLLQLYRILPNSDWERNISSNIAAPYWRLREWIFAQVLYSMPEDRKIILHMFGSTNPTSDIDVTVEAHHASHFIRAVEMQWQLLTGTSTIQWAVEFYGDFLIFQEYDGINTFINTRFFDQINDDEILTYVGVSILRNAGTFDFPELKKMLERYPSLNMSGWKENAQAIYRDYRTLSPEQKREEYYSYLEEAENLRDDKSFHSHLEKTRAVFRALCHANIFRNENYILPSTVIHIVRDIQAGSPKPSEPETQCSAFKVKLASCALGAFTYLCSALEQLGYMHKYKDVRKKYEKYLNRYMDAMFHLMSNNDMKEYNKHITESGDPTSPKPYNRSASPTGNPITAGGKRRKTQRRKRKSQSKRRRSKTRK